jgi:hypothetical protein
MDSPKVNLSSLISNHQKKIRDKDDYILEMTNITKEQLEKIDDEKYNKILEKIKETIKNSTTIENQKEEKVNSWINIDALNINNESEEEIENKKKKIVSELLNWDEETLEVEKDWEIEVFSNYKSDFKDAEKSVFNNLRKKRQKIQQKLRMPKTRIWLVISLVILTISVISGLFIFSPEHHSYSIYKANILELKVKYMGGVQNKISKDVIKIEDFFFDIEVEETKKWKIYKYDSKVFNNKFELDNYLNKQVEIKKEKLNTLTWEELEKYKEEIIRDALNHKYRD